MKKLLFSITVVILFINQNQAQMVYDVPGIAEAKFYYSDKPFTNSNEGAKTNFHSGEFIYGRLEFANKTLKEAFHLENIKNGPYYLQYYAVSYRGNQMQGEPNRFSTIRIENSQLNNKWLNFDVMPDPSKASSLIGFAAKYGEIGIEESAKFFSAPLYQIIVERSFPANDSYTIYTQFNMPVMDGWGKLLPEKDWPVAEGSFTFSFDAKDVAAIRNNETQALAKINTVTVDKLPAYFAKPVSISDPTVTVAKVTPLIKNYLGGDGYEVLKVAIEPAASMWSVVKNEVGIQSYRYVTGYYKIVYRKDGKCSLGSVRVFQDYIGNGKYGNLYCKFWGDEGDIDCSKVK